MSPTQEHLIYYRKLKHAEEQRAPGTFVTQLLPLHIESRPVVSAVLRAPPQALPQHRWILGPHIPQAKMNPKYFNAWYLSPYGFSFYHEATGKFFDISLKQMSAKASSTDQGQVKAFEMGLNVPLTSFNLIPKYTMSHLLSIYEVAGYIWATEWLEQSKYPVSTITLDEVKSPAKNQQPGVNIFLFILLITGFLIRCH